MKQLYERDVSFQSDYSGPECLHEYFIVFALISLPLFIVNNKQQQSLVERSDPLWLCQERAPVTLTNVPSGGAKCKDVFMK